ncbi:SDR family NAD(P)-dependent oxidoreductase [Novispirillum sp. DQ9]|uniref:SDR family NAD(P)-dependent oxidoreductase n=1 Tax=Novispirillum sp. DQ9 TaxID=3398612 RepID=UPI003C7D2C85
MRPPFSRIWITGASSGIGRHTALRLAALGVTVVASARSTAALEALAAEAPGRIHPVPVDVTDRAAVHAAFAEAEATAGPLDAALLCAGTHRPMSAGDFSAAVCEELMRVNYGGTCNALDALLPAFRARRAGRIAVVASVAGWRGLPTAAAYGPTKAALINLCESLYPGLREAGILMQVVNPGFVKTPLTDRNDFRMPHLMTPDAAADALIEGLCGDAFEIAFPRAFTGRLRLARLLPYRLWFPLVRKITGRT